MRGSLNNIHPALMANLTKLEHHVGYQLVVTSGYRDAAHNVVVGGVSNSEHTYPLAEGVDLR